MSKAALETMENYLYPSFIVCETGMFDVIEHPKTEILGDESHRCRLCAMPINTGVAAKHLSKGFTNMTDIACPHEPYVCEFCMTLMATKPVKAVQVVQGYRENKEANKNLFGMLYIGGSEARAIRVLHSNAAKLVLNPPVKTGEPFVFMRRVHHVLSNCTSRHSAWMARVNLNTSNYYLQVGTDALQVDVVAVKGAIKTLKKSENPSYPIYGADTLMRKIIKGEEETIANMSALSCYSHDTILVAAHLIESEKTAAKLKGKKEK